jgi:hypothetical protein
MTAVENRMGRYLISCGLFAFACAGFYLVTPGPRLPKPLFWAMLLMLLLLALLLISWAMNDWRRRTRRKQVIQSRLYAPSCYDAPSTRRYWPEEGIC